MNAKKRKKLAITLIANDLINSKLIYGLDALSIVAGAYALYLTVPILKLMGFRGKQRTEEVVGLYEELVKSYAAGAHGEPVYKHMSEQAEEIYQEMMDKMWPEEVGSEDVGQL